MKRMVNAFAMRQAIGVLERSSTPVAVLARWTILEQRFPALADLLIEHPEWVDKIATTIADDERLKLPGTLQTFANMEALYQIVGAGRDDCLTAGYVQTITRGSAG